MMQGDKCKLKVITINTGYFDDGGFVISDKIKMILGERPLGSVKLRTTQKCRKNKDDL